LTPLLLGQYGIWPWYRPLSREVLFWGLAHLGPIAAPAAHAVSLVCLFGAAWVLWQLAARVVGGRAALVAPALFVTYQFTKFVVAWASGFQDLLAVLLTLAAVLMHARGRPGRALSLAALAPFAKETGLVAGLLVVAWAVLCEGERRFRPWMLSYL